MGVGRSGTSLLQSMFATHPKINSITETSFVRRYLVSGRLRKLYKKGSIELIRKILDQDEKFSRLGVNTKKLDYITDSSQATPEYNFYLRIIKSVFKMDFTFLLDKDPKLIEFLPVLKKNFPEAIILHIIRDPREVLLSKKNAMWSKSGHVWKHVFANRIQLKFGRYFGPKLFGENYHEIFYEDLIKKPKKTLSQLCIKLGLDYDDSMLSFQVTAKELVSSDEMSWKKETIGPLLENNYEKWKSKLSHIEIKLTESCCSDAITAGHYEADKRNNPHQSLMEYFWLLAGTIIIKLATYPYLFYRNLLFFGRAQF